MTIDCKRVAISAVCVVLVAVLLCACGVAAMRTHTVFSARRRRSVAVAERMRCFEDMLTLVYAVARIVDARPFLTDGTLLGYHRSKDFICYDFDVDLGVHGNREYVDLQKALSAAVRAVPLSSVYLFRHIDVLDVHFMQVIHRRTGLNIDICRFEEGPAETRPSVPVLYAKMVMGQKRPSFPVPWLLPLKQGVMRGIQVFVPADEENVLRNTYGPDFETPDHECDGDCNNCRKVGR